ncbi:carbon-nitrogen hydrolase family protein [sulfur-oxidizing endosymbiont of Gigantopelta aegis]|uniref:carbon-nitrogen hydrolase family protein n=1 Tax=sulfur-oxidizing endosymbiont of Gigantopelta aegis TaxID=2794934 RepID=UPI0018DD73C0|nr:carbon-nitrogen hydrolase family protein [sulfur-oxidizing endosymbiont of Gigantopelta aegis]
MAKVAAIQMASGPNVSANLSEARRLISDAVKQGAELVVLPENFAHMGMSEADILNIAEDYLDKDSGEGGASPIQTFLSTVAKEENIWLVGGTLPIKAPLKDSADKIYTACLLLNNQGEVVARYDKIHLFDVDLGDQGGAYHESEFTEAGTEIIVADTPFGKLGLAICYDLRFPELFRGMVSQGMDVLCLVSSFTATTGKAHWEVLNRARAIENLCFVVSSAQGGYHVNGRETYGSSMIVDPWGGVIDCLPSGSGFAIADIEASRVQKTRKNFPVLDHIKLPCQLKT